MKQHRLFQVHMTSFVDNEDQLHVAKEAYYNGIYGPTGRPIFASFADTANGTLIDMPIRIDDAYMEKVSGKNTIQILCDSKTPRTAS